MSREYDVLSMSLSMSKRSETSKAAQGVSARWDDITGLLPVYDRCNGTMIDDSGWPVSVKAEMVTSRKEISWKYVL